MNKEFSAGAIIFRKEKKCPMFLLLYSNRNKIWSFPKGHIDQGETEKDAALREIKEESGISDLRFVEGFREELVYKAKSNRGPSNGTDIEKHSIYFLCETQSEKITTDGEEITDYKWGCYGDANKLLIFDNMKDLLDKAFTLACVSMPKNAKWKKVAINQAVDRYVLNVSEYGFPYYEVDHYSKICEDHIVYFVFPRNECGAGNDFREIVDVCNPQAGGPYYDHIKAIKMDSAKRGLPADIEPPYNL